MTKNIAASVRQRLINLAKDSQKPYNELLQHYALERWLYRMSVSPHANRFVLKGALMLLAWKVPLARPTRDIDLLARASNDAATIRSMVAEICATLVEADGLLFETTSIATEAITEDAQYEGVRVTFQGKLGTAKIPMQIDMGFSDVITPGPVQVDYPTVLEMPSPRLQAYNRETAIAEKFEAMVKLGDLNSRMKDFFDIWTLATGQTFEGKAVAAAIAKTFERRGTAVGINAVCFQQTFGQSDAKQTQWRAFVRRSGLNAAPAEFAEVWSVVVAFLRPVAECIVAGSAFDRAWLPGGPWKPV